MREKKRHNEGCREREQDQKRKGHKCYCYKKDGKDEIGNRLLFRTPLESKQKNNNYIYTVYFCVCGQPDDNN